MRLTLLASAALAVAAVVGARDAAPKPAAASQRTVEARTERIAQYFNRRPDEIGSLRLRGYGYGEIVKILVIAEMSRKPIDGLVERNQRGEGWGTIAKGLGLNTVYIKKRLDNARKELGIRTRPAADGPAKPAKKAR